jgi:hypothetical protein
VIADTLREFGGGTAFFDYAKHIAPGNGLAGELVIRERQEVGGQAHDLGTGGTIDGTPPPVRY